MDILIAAALAFAAFIYAAVPDAAAPTRASSEPVQDAQPGASDDAAQAIKP